MVPRLGRWSVSRRRQLMDAGSGEARHIWRSERPRWRALQSSVRDGGSPGGRFSASETLSRDGGRDGVPPGDALRSQWMVATLADFYVNVVAISTWVIYKEVNWINSVFWVVMLFCFGSAATCAYIVNKLFEITPSGPSQDPLDLLLLRQSNLPQRKCSFVLTGRIIFSILGVLMAAAVIYTVVTDGLPFRKDLLTPWMAATLIDFYINVFAISVWVVHKELTWISSVIWICLLICFGSITTCGYIVVQLFQVSYQDPICDVLLNSHSKNV